MAAEQDWCLACGSGASPRLVRRPGWRAAVTVIGLTLALVVGAVAASYAALTDQPAKPPAQLVAQAPGTVEPTPTPTTPAAAPTKPTGTTPTPTPTTPSKLPTVSVPTTSTPTVTPTPVTPSGEGDTDTPPVQPAEPKQVAIELADGAGSVYDPYGRAVATGDPGRALDDNHATSWYVDPKAPALIGVGLALDLGTLRGVKAIELETSTPGFTIEVYATDEATLPPDILDTRWTHLRDVTKVGVVDPKKATDVEGTERMALGAGTTKYRILMLWLTVPPTDAPRLRIAELKLFR